MELYIRMQPVPEKFIQKNFIYRVYELRNYNLTVSLLKAG